jgi:predicted outer membrane repeat protein
MEIRDSIFNNNFADNGGAIYNTDGLSILNCTFTGNVVNADPYSDDYDDYYRGGAIYNSGAVDVKGSVFSSNHADVTGGAIYNVDSLYVENCKFISNTAEHGGAIATLTGLHLVIDNNEFINNAASSDGGAIYKTTSGILGNNRFTGNTPNNIKIIPDDW